MHSSPNSALKSRDCGLAPVQRIVQSIIPFDEEEKAHIAFIQQWISSGAEIFRIIKPATPNIHLVSYFLLVDPSTDKVLLVDHKKAELWLPAGGHVEPNEHPRDTVKREIFEELGINADFFFRRPYICYCQPNYGSE